jgi:PAS domain S-box-containing protein
MQDEGSNGAPAARSPWRDWLAFGLGYLVLSALAEWLSSDTSQFATFWPGAGLYVGALLVAERRRWAGTVAIAALVDVGVSVAVGRRPIIAASLVAGDAIEALLAATLILQVLRHRPRMWLLRDLVVVVVLGAALAPVFPAALGGAATALSVAEPFASAWLHWWAGDALGILVFTPLVLAWATRDPLDRNPVPRRPAEFLALLAASAAVSAVVFQDAQRGAIVEEHVVLPVFVWAALRFGPRGATATCATLALAATVATGWASHAGAADALPPDAFQLQGYLALAIATTLALATEVAGRERNQRGLALARYALDQGGDAILVTTVAGRIVLASEAAARLAGRGVRDLVGSNVGEIDAELGRRIAAGDPAALTAPDGARYETRLADRAGRRPPVEVHLAPISYEGSWYLAWSGRDLSERRQAEEEHRLAAVGTLAAGVAHEINNPLTCVTSNLAFVEETLARMEGLHPDATEAREAAEEAALGARRVRDIVRDLRFVARPPGGRSMEVDPVDEVRTALNLAQSEISRRARLDLALERCPTVLASQGQIGQVMIHLLVNAAQSIPSGAPEVHLVRVSAGTDAGGWASIGVADSGAGIPAEVQARIFEPFFTTRPTGSGAGLGLAVCRGIVASLGGSIDVASEVGRGTTVRIRLPPAHAEVAPPA